MCVCLHFGAHIHIQARLMIPENVCGLACVRKSISTEINVDTARTKSFGIVLANKNKNERR